MNGTQDGGLRRCAANPPYALTYLCFTGLKIGHMTPCRWVSLPLNPSYKLHRPHRASPVVHADVQRCMDCRIKSGNDNRFPHPEALGASAPSLEGRGPGVGAASFEGRAIARRRRA